MKPTKEERCAYAIQEIIDAALEYDSNPANAIGVIECAKLELHGMLSKKAKSYEEMSN